MPPKSLLTVASKEAPPPFVIRHADEDWGTQINAHQQRIMNQNFMVLGVPSNLNEARAAPLQEQLDGAMAPVSVTQKMGPSIPIPRLFEHADVRSFVRVRPIVESIDKTVKGTSASVVQKVPGKKDAIIYMPRLNASGTTLDALSVSVDGVFSPKDDTEVVYETVVPQLLLASVQGGCTSVICYGQTGSGKSHTAFGILRCLSKDLELHIDTLRVKLSVVELLQTSLQDVLGGDTAQIVETEQGITFEGAQEAEITKIELFNKLVDAVERSRAKHPKAASKTTLIFRLTFRNRNNDWTKPGTMTIVDLAGSEKANDAETRYVGAAFTALKDCLRIRAIQKANQTAMEGSVPLRTTSLTYALKDSLDVSSRTTRCSVISCISPSFTNLRATFETMRMATLCSVHPGHTDNSASAPQIVGMKADECAELLSRLSFGRLRHVGSILPENFDGRKLVNMSEEQFLDMLCVSAPSDIRATERVAKSVFQQMQNIAIATKALGGGIKAPVMSFGGPKRPQDGVTPRGSVSKAPPRRPGSDTVSPPPPPSSSSNLSRVSGDDGAAGVDDTPTTSSGAAATLPAIPGATPRVGDGKPSQGLVPLSSMVPPSKFIGPRTSF